MGIGSPVRYEKDFGLGWRYSVQITDGRMFVYYLGQYLTDRGLDDHSPENKSDSNVLSTHLRDRGIGKWTAGRIVGWVNRCL